METADTPGVNLGSASFFFAGFFGAAMELGAVVILFRFLYVKTGSSAFSAMYMSTRGLAMGIAPVIGGLLLDIFGDTKTQFLDSYKLSFLLNTFIFIIPFIIISKLSKEEHEMEEKEFLKIFNPFRFVKDYFVDSLFDKKKIGLK